jgi:hypothetical protein
MPLNEERLVIHPTVITLQEKTVRILLVSSLGINAEISS